MGNSTGIDTFAHCPSLGKICGEGTPSVASRKEGELETEKEDKKKKKDKNKDKGKNRGNKGKGS